MPNCVFNIQFQNKVIKLVTFLYIIYGYTNAYLFFLTIMHKLHGWCYAYAVQRIATSPFNKVLTTNCAGKQQGAD